MTIDRIVADSLGSTDRILILTTGLHGIEGYVGAAVLHFFLDQFMPKIDPEESGLLLVHGLNPWGMENRRRTNRSNVDLNRNFLEEPKTYDTGFNPDYLDCSRLLNPAGKLNSWIGVNLEYFWQLGLALVRRSTVAIRRAMTLGQYAVPEGLYYGGNTEQEESRVIKSAILKAIAQYAEVSLLEVHSGYGPRDELTLLHSPLEPESVAKLQEQLQYSSAVKADVEGFFEISGDMIDHFYSRVGRDFPEKLFYGVTLEFGTFGDTFFPNVRGLRALALENRAWHYGCKDAHVGTKVREEFERMFAPADQKWLEKAQQDTEYVLDRILKWKGFISGDQERSQPDLA